MNIQIKILVAVIGILWMLPLPALADEKTPPASGEVKVPLDDYQHMLEALRNKPKPAPAGYALGSSQITATINERDSHFSAEVIARFKMKVFESQWTLVPLLPAGTAVDSAMVNNVSVQLVQGADGLSWGTNKAGEVSVQLKYQVDAQVFAEGYVLPLPVPRITSTLTVTVPGKNTELVVLPSAGSKHVESGAQTRVDTTIPATAMVSVSWRKLSEQDFAISRASYKGKLADKAVVWNSEFHVEVFSAEAMHVPLMPTTTTLGDVNVDGKPATVFTETINGTDMFTTLIKGRGKHSIGVRFHTPVADSNGPPRVSMAVPRIPVSRFELSLPGKKEVSVEPASHVEHSGDKDNTHVVVLMPLGDEVSFSWIEAIPEDVKTELRANAEIYHAVHAEEGVLHVRAFFDYDITRGEAKKLEIALPDDIQVNRISSPTGGVNDWTVTDTEQGGPKKLTVFLDRAVTGHFMLIAAYEKLITADDTAIGVPLLQGIGLHRQRGMLALLSGRELALSPVEETQLTRVGENQLPADVRNQIQMTVAHTFKYSASAAGLTVKAAAPERRQGKFDAQVDTLISIDEVTLKGSASVEIGVKSGAIMALDLSLPKDVNVLDVTGPSIRSHKVEADDKAQWVRLAFTQDMTGQFRISLNYEFIMLESSSEVVVPTVSVAEAEVEHGRIAVEALTAAEVKAVKAEQLSAVDLGELPKQLVLKTTNPILLAQKYIYADPPHQLVLQITRHKELSVQEAAIEQAEYRTLFTQDGLAVTTARFTVHNSRRQFLRLNLPKESKIWSVFVNGNAEKPAMSEQKSSDGTAVLLKMINSTNGFPVELVYATPSSAVGGFGKIKARLPKPDMIVTKSVWRVYVPEGMKYFTPRTSMRVVSDGRMVHGENMGMQQVKANAALRINVPATGMLFEFEKLYANQSDGHTWIAIPYTTGSVDQAGYIISIAGVLLAWFAVIVLRQKKISLPVALAVFFIGLFFSILAITALSLQPGPAIQIALLIGVLLIIAWAVQWVRNWRIS